MSNYTIKVNGKSYDVTVEKQGCAQGTVAAPPKAMPASQQVPVPSAPTLTAAPAAPKASPAGAASKAAIIAPMPGKVIEVKVKVGDSVKKGQELIIVEAMKMHNPVLAAADGVVQEVFVKAGDAIQTGTPLISVG
jgi:glutaconyl-CoA decarboxylase